MKKYDILQVPYENIFHYLSNDIDFVLFMLIFFDKNLVKLVNLKIDGGSIDYDEVVCSFAE